MKNWKDYLKMNEDVQEEEEHGSYYDYSEPGSNLRGCKIIGFHKINDGVKLDIRDSAGLLGWCIITVKNGQLDINTEFYNYDDDDEF